jgi:hypothetical protein
VVIVSLIEPEQQVKVSNIVCCCAVIGFRQELDESYWPLFGMGLLRLYHAVPFLESQISHRTLRIFHQKAKTPVAKSLYYPVNSVFWWAGYMLQQGAQVRAQL